MTTTSAPNFCTFSGTAGTDVTAQLAAALTYAGANDLQLIIPDGTWILSGLVNTSQPVVIRGQSSKAIIQRSASATYTGRLIALQGANSSIANLTIDDNGTNVAGINSGALQLGASGCVAESINIINTYFYGVYITAANCTVRNSSISGMATPSTVAYGIYCEASISGTSIINNSIISVGLNGIGINGTNFAVRGNYITGNSNYGIVVPSGSSNYYVISGNNLQGNTNGAISDGGTGVNESILNNVGVDDVVPTVASAATLTLPINPVIYLTGTTGITSFTGPNWTGRTVTIIPASTVVFTAGNNIATSLTTAPNVPITATYNGTSWYLSSQTVNTNAVITALGFTPDNPTASSITGGNINGTPIGSTTPAAGSFTTIAGTASGVNVVAPGTSVSRTLTIRTTDLGINVKDFGALGNTQQQNAGGISSTTGSNILTWNNPFTSADYGKWIQIQCTNQTFVWSGIIQLATSTTVTISTNSPGTISASTGTVYWGTDDSAAIAAAINYGMAQFNATGNRRIGSFIYFPPGQYYVATTQIPTIYECPLGIRGAGKGAVGIIVDPTYAYDVFSWSTCYNSGVGGSATQYTYGSYNWGGFDVRDFTIVGNLNTPYGSSSALAFYDLNDHFIVDNIQIFYWLGRGIWAGGGILNSNSGGGSYVYECAFNNIRVSRTGSATLPMVEFGSTGSGDANNEIFISNWNLFAPLADGFVIRNNATINPIRLIKGYGIRVEDTLSGFSAIRLGDTTYSGPGIAITGVTGTGTTATFTFATQSTPPFVVGRTLYVVQVTPTDYNGTWVVTAVTTSSVTVTCPSVDAYVSGGYFTSQGIYGIQLEGLEIVTGQTGSYGITLTGPSYLTASSITNCRFRGVVVNAQGQYAINHTNGTQVEYDFSEMGSSSGNTIFINGTGLSPNPVIRLNGMGVADAPQNFTQCTVLTPTYNRASDTGNSSAYFGVDPHDGIGLNGASLGQGSVDLQKIRTTNTQVAVGNYTFILAGSQNATTSTAQYSGTSGYQNSVAGSEAFAWGYRNTVNTATNNIEIVGSNGLAVSSNRRILAGAYLVQQGDSQISDIILSCIATGTTATAILAQATTTVSVTTEAAITLPQTITAAGVDITIMAISKTSNGRWYRWDSKGGVLYTQGTAANLVYTAPAAGAIILSAGTVTGAAIALVTDTTNGGIYPTFTPPTSNTDTWHVTARIHFTEVG